MMFTSPVGQVFSVARYFDLAADKWSDVIEVQRLTGDVNIALALSAPGCLRAVTVAAETFELITNNLRRIVNSCRTINVR